MNILWISFLGAWTMPLLNEIKSNNKTGIIVPILDRTSFYKKKENNGIIYFYLHLSKKECTKNMTKQTFDKYNKIIQEFNPDIIHVHGTEKNLAQIQNYIHKIPVAISIQGLLSGYKSFTYNYIDKKKVSKFRTIKNHLNFGGINLMYQNFCVGETYENNILQHGKYFIGRTKWDEAHIIFNNPDAHYFHGEEILRKEFYEHAYTWKVEKCARYSIFMPSGFNPIKGMHLAIETIRLLKEAYPNVLLNVPGICNSKKDLMKLINPITGEEYIRYIYYLIKKYHLNNNINLLPQLSSQEMVRQMQQANVFLSPSSIDNSPNAVGEATMIGVPIVTTPVGGVTSFMKDEENSLFAPAGDPYMMAYQIKRIFENDSLANKLSKNAFQVAQQRHNALLTGKQYINIYKDIIDIHNKMLQVNYKSPL